MRPIVLEIVSQVLTTFGRCRHCEFFFDQTGLKQKCHQNEINEYPSDLKEEYLKLSDWIRELRRLYKHRLLIKLIDIQSPLGIYKALRHRIRTYPAFIVERSEIYTGWDKNELEGLLDKYIRMSLLPKGRNIRSKPS